VRLPESVPREKEFAALMLIVPKGVRGIGEKSVDELGEGGVAGKEGKRGEQMKTTLPSEK